MCGIAVAIDWEDAHGHVQRLIDGILHRGDISDRIATPRANVAMGTRRLRIVDAAHGDQPQPSFDGKLLVSFNGEIYNHVALRAELEAMGIGFRTESDTEVLANALRAWGAQALKRLRGMYAFVAYDVTNGEFLAARDPFGVKPLYLVQTGTGFLFCSEIRPLLKTTGTGDVMLLPPGHLLTRNFCTRFYALPAPAQLGASSPEALDEILCEAMESRLPPDLPVAGLFSGGIDSTLMMHYARRIRPEMPGYFIGEPDAPDYKYARAYADRTGMDMREVTPPPRGAGMLALLRTVVETCESFEPSVVRPSLYSYLVSERIHRDGFRVALCGEGADELFAGYGPLEHTFAQSDTLGRHVQEQCLSFMHRANLQRVDRCGMRFELEVREPFLDLKLVEHAAHLDAKALLAMVDGLPQGKQPLRAIYDLYPDALPREIRNRRKVQFDEGAGIASERGDWAAMFEDAVSDRDFADGRRQFATYDIATKEELYYMRALAAAMDVDRLPHLKGRMRLCVPADTPAMPEATKRLAPSV